MGNNTSRVVGCFIPSNGKHGVDLEFLEPLDEGLGHSFCYIRPSIFDSPAITPSNSERFTVDSSILDSETFSGSFIQDTIDDPSGLYKSGKYVPETTFKTISGASVSANVKTARTCSQSALFASDMQEPAASFESTASFAAIPLQPLPRGSGPLNGFMSGPLERVYASGPLDKGSGFMSGPMEKGVMSGPLDSADISNFSAPLARGRRRPRFHFLVRSVSGPVKSTLSQTFSRHSMGLGWMHKILLRPVTQLAWQVKEPKFHQEVMRNCSEGRSSEGEYMNSRNLQWAHGKAGEDRIQVVISEEHGWLFAGIYDGFSGPDATDFLMSNLYRAIDKELEGLLWDYEDNASSGSANVEVQKSEIYADDSGCSRGNQPSLSADDSCNVGESNNPGLLGEQFHNCEIMEEADNNGSRQQQSFNCKKATISGSPPFSVPTSNLTGQVRKSMRLYELLQMESCGGLGTTSISVVDKQSRNLHYQQSLDVFGYRQNFQEGQVRVSSLNDHKGDGSSCRGEDPTTSGEDSASGVESNNQGSLAKVSVLQRQSLGKSNIGSKLRQMCRKQKSLRKKLFPWSYDWHRKASHTDERVVESSGPIRRRKSVCVDHDAVLRAMTCALEHTEEAYMEMVEKDLKHPELALMGSCLLVVLMKYQDVYIMNIGDSRAILAQERPNDRQSNPSYLKDDIRPRNRLRESLVGMELDRISEESPIHSLSSQVNVLNKNREISICRLKMRAVQLSTDHSTSIEEEVLRIKAEHPDDSQAILNDRVKGQLKVTRAFGAGFLKKPSCNDALLHSFRIAYVGSKPYISCIPSILHHRLSSSDRFLVLSSDGLYQYFSNEEVVSHVTWFMEKVPEGDPAQYLIAELLVRAAKKNGMGFHDLLDIPHGDRRKYHDDVSVLVVSLEGRIWRSSG
ncbi:hypothetical protein K2173_003410 [Erythroxylum novogranatense]|uniref:PPM-type phosphatase domain-containing protein n=1 Tax=Erythroxylum novogranatense TaxID=1862640 RepID=A0AAV8S8J9_9ROSI|nr:hypothetical protein K2173_003410 [Erythroxylum novogranatense]